MRDRSEVQPPYREAVTRHAHGSAVPQSGRLRDRLFVFSSALLSFVGLPCRCASGVPLLRFRAWLCVLTLWEFIYRLTKRPTRTSRVTARFRLLAFCSV